MRTQTLVKGAIIQIDAAPFKQWYQQHYGTEVGVKKKSGAAAAAAASDAEAAAAQSSHVKRKLKARNQGHKLDVHLDDQFATGRLYASISSRPGQVSRPVGLSISRGLEQIRLVLWASQRSGVTPRPAQVLLPPSPFLTLFLALALPPLLLLQCGRADGYVLEGRELEFYIKKMQKKKVGVGGGSCGACAGGRGSRLGYVCRPAECGNYAAADRRRPPPHPLPCLCCCRASPPHRGGAPRTRQPVVVLYKLVRHHSSLLWQAGCGGPLASPVLDSIVGISIYMVCVSHAAAGAATASCCRLRPVDASCCCPRRGVGCGRVGRAAAKGGES